MVALKNVSYEKYERKLKLVECLDLLILDDEISANAITKRATKHYTVVVNTKNNQ